MLAGQTVRRALRAELAVVLVETADALDTGSELELVSGDVLDAHGDDDSFVSVA